MEWIFLGLLAGAVWLTVWGIRSLFRGLSVRPTAPGVGHAGAAVTVAGIAATAAMTAGATSTGATSAGGLSAAGDEIDGMNEGDYHSGPAGYSPMTAYPETQYGSGFDEDAEWHEEQ